MPRLALVVIARDEARCLVFDGLEDLANRIDDEGLDVTPQDILILKNAGPLTPAGMLGVPSARR